MLPVNRSQFLERNLLPISLISLALIAVILVVGAILIRDRNATAQDDARVINIAGRQRMLSQQISKNAALIGSTENSVLRAAYTNELSDGVELWRSSHDALRFGSEDLQIDGDNSTEVDQLYASIQASYEIMLANAECLIALERGNTLNRFCSDDKSVLVEGILDEEGDFLRGMNRIVFQYEAEADELTAEREDLELGLLIASLSLLAVLAILVFLPLGIATRNRLYKLTTSQASLETREQELSLLQQQAQQRARNLQAVIDLSERVAEVTNLDQLLRDISDISRDQFELYHAHVYMIDEDDQLRLVAGAGYVGEQMVLEDRSINLNDPNSVVARAARSFDNVVINDVRRSVNFLPHPLLPNTRSEMAIALLGRGRLMGVLDLQSDRTGFFNAERIVVMEAVAAQVATAISNATLFASLQRVTAHEQALGNISRVVERATTVDEVLQTTVRELGKALRVPYTAIELQLNKQTTTNGKRTE